MTLIKKWDVLLVALILLSLICVFYSHVLFFDELFIKRDIGRYYYPLRKLARQQFESGGFPFWNPYLFCGLPLFATLQSCVLYPISIINYLGEFSHMFNCFILFHIFLAGIFMYVLMKELGLSRLGSFLAAFGFAFSGYMLSAINLTISLSSTAWFPLLLYFYNKTRIIRIKRNGLNGYPLNPYKIREIRDKNVGKNSYKWALFSAFTLVMMLLAGDPAVVYISIVVLFCISSYLFLERLIEKKIFTLKYFKSFFITLVLFLLLSAFQTIPFLEFLRLTDRKNMAWWVASGWSVPVTDLLSLVIPFFNDINWYFGDYWQVQSWLDNYYMGLIPLCLCFVGAFFDKSKKTNLLILVGVFSLALVLGKYSAFYAVLYKFLPFFKFIRYPVRFFFLVAFSIAALSGIGLDYFRNNIKGYERLKRFSKGLLIFSFLAVISLVLLISFSGTLFVKLWNTILPIVQDNDPTKSIADLYTYIFMDFYNLKRAIALFSIFGLIFFLGAKKGIKPRALCLIFIGIALCDVLATNLKYEPTMDIRSYAEPTENIKFLQRDKSLFRIAVSPQIGRFHSRLPEKTYCEGTYASKDRLISNRMVEYGIYDIAGYDSMYLSRQNRLLQIVFNFKKPNESRILDMLNVKYICTNKMDPKKEGYRLVNKTKAAYLFRNLNWLPRAYLAERPIVITDEDKIIEKLKDKAFDPRKEVILEDHSVIASSDETSPSVIASGQRKTAYRGKRSNPEARLRSLFRARRWIASSPRQMAGFLAMTGEESPRNDNVQFVTYKPNEVIIKASIDSPKFLILADSYYPGWKVFIDGRPDKIYRANYILRAVYLKEPGGHIVRFVYDPFSFKLGVGITLLGTVLYAAVLSCPRKRASRNK